LHILVSDKLKSVAYQGVQAAHATAQYLLDNPSQQWNNNRLVVLEANLDDWIFKLNLKEIQFTSFYEPDIDSISAIALASPLAKAIAIFDFLNH